MEGLSMGGLCMPGGWSMSMLWMASPGESRLAAAAAFMAMWTVMMAAMMLPSLVQTLSRYRRVLGDATAMSEARIGIAGLGYLLSWILLGAIVYPVALAFAAAVLQSEELARSVPALTGIALLIAGSLQFTPWKARQLRRCRGGPICVQRRGGNLRHVWRDGIRMGLHCVLCCAGFTLAMLATGMMNLWTMLAIAAAVTLERLAPRPERFVQASGIAMAAAGILAIVQ